ncbi:MAG: PHP domain-containing protein [Deltaproteobacteria bacterium]|nr:MAG: PHP domain-containing protein [Deltaproteobacteria bacterium]
MRQLSGIVPKVIWIIYIGLLFISGEAIGEQNPGSYNQSQDNNNPRLFEGLYGGLSQLMEEINQPPENKAWLMRYYQYDAFHFEQLGYQMTTDGKQIYSYQYDSLDFEQFGYQLILDDGQRDMLDDVLKEVKRMAEEGTLEVIWKASLVGLETSFGYAGINEIPDLGTAPRWCLEQDIAVNAVLRFLNTRKITKKKGELVIDPHNHSLNSHDSVATMEHKIKQAYAKGFNAIAITDHNRFDGAVAAHTVCEKLKANGEIGHDFFIIFGEEITTTEGYYVIALFTTRSIPKGMTVKETIRQIHAQGGIAIAAHPVKMGTAIGYRAALDLDFDWIEAINASDIGPYQIYRSRRMMEDARVKGKSIVFGGNNHINNLTGWLGYTMVETDEVSLEGIKQALRKGKARPVGSGPYLYLERLAEMRGLRDIYFVFDRIEWIREMIEAIGRKLLLADNFSLNINWILPIHQFLNIYSIPIAIIDIQEEESPLTEPFGLDSIAVAYGPVELSWRFKDEESDELLEKATIKIKFKL